MTQTETLFEMPTEYAVEAPSEWAPPPEVFTPEGSFDRCKDVSADYAASLRAEGKNARWVQLSGSPLFPMAVAAWREVPESARLHYVVKVDGVYVDWTARQFDPSAEVPLRSSDMGWRAEYDVTDALPGLDPVEVPAVAGVCHACGRPTRGYTNACKACQWKGCEATTMGDEQ